MVNRHDVFPKSDIRSDRSRRNVKIIIYLRTASSSIKRLQGSRSKAIQRVFAAAKHPRFPRRVRNTYNFLAFLSRSSSSFLFFFLSFVSRNFHPSDLAILALATPLGNSRMILQRRSRTALIKRFALNVSIIPFPQPLRSRDIDYIVPFLFS